MAVGPEPVPVRFCSIAAWTRWQGWQGSIGA
jgi:hypothetical protein